MPTCQILTGDCRDVLKTLPNESVNCIVTSPPYFGLRDYGTARWSGGDSGCKHLERTGGVSASTLGEASGGNAISAEARKRSTERSFVPYREVCGKCGAIRTDKQIGLEKTIHDYTQTMVEVFRECHRALRKDGTFWLNLGDSYAVSRSYQVSDNKNPGAVATGHDSRCRPPEGLKQKDLIGIPWMIAFALRADGWYLRSDIIWAKPNPMPESVTDRPTKSHEYIFLFSKSEKYFYDAQAIAEPVMESSLVRADAGVAFGGNNLCPDTRLQSGKQWIPKAEGTNSRLHKSHDPAHEREYNGKHRSSDDQASGRRMLVKLKNARANGGPHDAPFGVTRNKRTVWTVPLAPFKGSHFATFPPDLIKPCILAGCPVGGTVMDPFFGSGTTGEVALELGRNCIGIELNPDYAAMAERRTHVTPGLALA